MSAVCDELLDRLDGAADDTQLAADLLPHEDQGDDGDDRDKRKDECIFGQTLAVLVSPRLTEPRGDPPELGHLFTSFRRSPEVGRFPEDGMRRPRHSAR